MVARVADRTLLWSEGTGPIRAWDLGPSCPEYVLQIETQLLPPLRYSDLQIERDGDWVTLPKGSGGWIEDFPFYLHGSTREAWRWLQGLGEAQPCKLIDMMDAPDHVAHWRRDEWLLARRETSPWTKNLFREGMDCWYLKVVNVTSVSANMVVLPPGEWRAYGLRVWS